MTAAEWIAKRRELLDALTDALAIESEARA